MRDQKRSLDWKNEVVESWISQLSLRVSAMTIEEYSRDVRKFMAYLDEAGVGNIKRIKQEHIETYLGRCRMAGKSDASIWRYYMSIRSFCSFLRKTKRIAVDLLQGMKAPRVKSKPPRVPTQDEIAKIIAMPQERAGPFALRDTAILMLLYSSGLRASELCGITMDDYTGRSILIREAKRGKARTLPITWEAEVAIHNYIKGLRGEFKGYLFQTITGRKLNRTMLCEMVKKYANYAGVDGVTTHTLRHACATHLLDEGADLRLIQELLGHANISMTERYTHLSSSKMTEKFNQFHPRRPREH